MGSTMQPATAGRRNDGIERINDGDLPLGVILRGGYEPESIEFLTSPADTLQLGVMCRPGGYQIPPHIHQPAPRGVEYTFEVLFIARGRLEITFYGDDRRVVTQREVARGDCVLLMRGGHGFRMIEDCKLIEVKQGPYVGADADKARFTP